MKREDIIDLFDKPPVGIELGVAEGMFSHLVLSRKEVQHWYSVDMWAGDRGHDVNQYKKAVSKLLPYKEKNTVLKLRFDEALSLFPDEFFDFIYVDGYAHTGQDGGKTFDDWWPKLKSGGIFAGDDYDARWQPTVTAVDNFIKKNNLELHIFNFDEERGSWSQYPSWYTYKG